MRRRVPVLIQRLDPDLPLPSYARPGMPGRTSWRATMCSSGRGARPGRHGRGHRPCRTGMPPSSTRARASRPGTGSPPSTVPGPSTPATVGRSRSTSSTSTRPCPSRVRRGDRIAQLAVQEVAVADLVEVTQLPDSARGSGATGIPAGSPPPTGSRETPGRTHRCAGHWPAPGARTSSVALFRRRAEEPDVAHPRTAWTLTWRLLPRLGTVGLTAPPRSPPTAMAGLGTGLRSPAPRACSTLGRSSWPRGMGCSCTWRPTRPGRDPRRHRPGRWLGCPAAGLRRTQDDGDLGRDSRRDRPEHRRPGRDRRHRRRPVRP